MLEHAKDIEFVKGFPTVAAFFDYARFVRAGISLHKVDVVLLDLRLADLSMPYDNAKALIDKKLKVLVYSSLESPYLIRDVLRAGVHGVFEKNRSTEELLDAIRIVSTGNTHATTEWASIIDSNYQALGVDLSPRQQEVLELIASGKPTELSPKCSTFGKAQSTTMSTVFALNSRRRGVRPKGEEN